MIWEVIVRAGDSDKFVASKGDRKQIYVNLFGKPSGGNVVLQNIDDLVKQFNLQPSDAAKDLLTLAIAIYTADKMINRAEAFDNWSRDIKLDIPVIHPELWQKQTETLEALVDFLSGDHWEFSFRQAETDIIAGTPQPSLLAKKDKVNIALLSGGLDSFIGAIDLLEETTKDVYFVSHYGMGNILRPIQQQVLSFLDDHYKNRVISVQSLIQPPGTTEESQRSRSFLFISLGIFISDGLAKSGNLYVNENGFISLNVPLSANRIGSTSTRTTHPYVITTMQQIIHTLKLDVQIENPYKYMTKGEMIENSKNSALLKQAIPLTRSCSKSDLRWKKYDPKGHCGICMPCLIRRAALRKAGIQEGSFLFDATATTTRLTQRQGGTIRALKIFLEQFELGNESPLFALLSSGSIPEVSGDIEEYQGVFTRGLKEVSKLFL